MQLCYTLFCLLRENHTFRIQLEPNTPDVRTFIVTLFTAISTLCFAGDGWTIYSTNGTVKIYYRYVDCNDPTNGINKQKVVFRFENTGSKNAMVSFDRKRAYSNGKNTDEVSHYQVKLTAGQTLEGECATRDNSLFIFVKHLDMQGPELKNFELNNITVTPAE